MPLGKSPKVKPHMFMPGETITAAIKLYNFYDVTKEEMATLLKAFTGLNGAKNFKPGERGLIPILERHHAEAFKKKK
jgi:hypothetical protein